MFSFEKIVAQFQIQILNALRGKETLTYETRRNKKELVLEKSFQDFFFYFREYLWHLIFKYVFIGPKNNIIIRF